MKTHFPQVPIEVARSKATASGLDFPLPLVFVVDDEPLIAETLAAILNGSGLAAYALSDATSALELAQLMPPEMLITDIAMPGINGIDLAFQVIQSIPDCEIILFSGQATALEMAASLQGRGRDVITLAKPVHPSDLLSSVHQRFTARGRVLSPPALKPVVNLQSITLKSSASDDSGNVEIASSKLPN